MANYAARSNGVQVGAHTILEMDEDRSSGNKIFLKNVGEEAGVQQFTGEIYYITIWPLLIFEDHPKVVTDKQKTISWIALMKKQTTKQRISCSLDPITNSETTNHEFQDFFKQ